MHASASHTGSQRWLLPYADVVTLLFALFAYQYFAVSPGHPAETATPGPPPVAAAAAPPVDSSQRQQLEQQLGLALKNVDSKTVQVEQQERGVVVVLSDSPLLFTPGSSQIAPEGKKLLSRFVPLMQHTRVKMRIEGHADNTPIHDAIYQDNYFLSLARAGAVARCLLDQGADPDRLALMAYGERRPVASNATPEGRGRNRRVEILFEY
ncbi:MAG: OmpA family protein [Vulcanimicrobiota bacterium]